MTLVYSRKAYTDDTEFAELVESTAHQANSQEHHIKLIKAELPDDMVVTPYYTYEHDGMVIELLQRCQFDSSADAFVATNDTISTVVNILTAINKDNT